MAHPRAPFAPLIHGERLLAFLAKHTVKYRNLLRDSRYAIHAVLGDSDEKFLVAGRAIVSDDWATRIAGAIEAHKINMTSTNDVAFEFMINYAHRAIWRGLGTTAIRREAVDWRATRGES